MTRSIPVPYYPYPIPTDINDIPRYLYEELQRIQIALVEQPTAFAIEDSADYTVTTILTWERLFDDGVIVPSWDVPGGSFDNTTGEWTCPQSGLYDINAQMTVQPYGAGNKTYYAGLRLYRLRDQTVEYREATDGGDDAIPLGVTLNGLVPLLQGDVLALDAAVVHDQFVGVATVNVGWQILRESN
jgi:hypothetical protein